MVQLQNFFFFITSMVVPHGTAAPVLLKWFVSRDVPTSAPSSNGTIIPIPIPEFPLLVYLYSRKFIRSMDGAKSGVLVRASRPILLPDIIGRSSSETRARNASFRFVPVLHFLLLESKGDLSYLESFCGVLCLLFFRTLFSLPRDRSAKRERARRRKRQTLRPNRNEQRRNDKMRCPGHPHLEKRVEGLGPVAFPVPPSSGGASLALPTSRQLMVVGHDYYQKAPMKIHISHGGVYVGCSSVVRPGGLCAPPPPGPPPSYLFRGGHLAARKHPVADHTERHESAGNASWRSRDDIIYVRTAPRGVDPASNQAFDQGTGEFPLPLAGQPSCEHGGNGLPKKPARARVSIE
ncbi:hypothetical protein NE237_005350 [Protea cynaroides]|uniref:Cytochrome c biogenesis FC n=1 Tax=Protea cynaroides TaxID=273540 RepID=A0A9Q0KKM9_9MAGN|nr:hypothetical protein NE237_005350 [Protea cynaroides]